MASTLGITEYSLSKVWGYLSGCWMWEIGSMEDCNTKSHKAQERARELRFRSDELHRKFSEMKDVTEKLLRHIDNESWKIVMTEIKESHRNSPDPDLI